MSFSAVILVITLMLAAIYILDIVYKGEFRAFLRVPTQILNTVYGGAFDPLSLILTPIFIFITFIFDMIFDKLFGKLYLKKTTSK